MSGFRKARCEQAAVKMAMYGPQGSGKTFTALLFAEGLAQRDRKRVAFVDTENGTAFYSIAVAERNPHPAAFDFDALYTRSIQESLEACKSLDPAEHGVIVIDSVSHLWDTAIASYSGPKTGAGTIPMWAWGKIKAPYKALMKFLIDSPYHVFILGRQANVFEEDEQTGESKAAGYKMRAEGETAYEPHCCVRMVPQRTHKEGKKTIVHREQVIAALFEKDRSGINSGKLIEWPNYESVIAPMLGIFGSVQGATPSDEDAAAHDAEVASGADAAKAANSADLREKYLARFKLAETQADLKAITKELTPAVKVKFLAPDLEAVRNGWLDQERRLKGGAAPAREREPGEEG